MSYFDFVIADTRPSSSYDGDGSPASGWEGASPRPRIDEPGDGEEVSLSASAVSDRGEKASDGLELWISEPWSAATPNPAAPTPGLVPDSAPVDSLRTLRVGEGASSDMASDVDRDAALSTSIAPSSPTSARRSSQTAATSSEDTVSTAPKLASSEAPSSEADATDEVPATFELISMLPRTTARASKRLSSQSASVAPAPGDVVQPAAAPERSSHDSKDHSTALSSGRDLPSAVEQPPSLFDASLGSRGRSEPSENRPTPSELGRSSEPRSAGPRATDTEAHGGRPRSSLRPGGAAGPPASVPTGARPRSQAGVRTDGAAGVRPDGVADVRPGGTADVRPIDAPGVRSGGPEGARTIGSTSVRPGGRTGSTSPGLPHSGVSSSLPPRAPDVVIERIDVVVEAPAPSSSSESASRGERVSAADFASARYLRRL